MDILITGSFGFVGSNLSLSIKSKINCKLFALDIREPKNHLFEKVYFWDDLHSLQKLNFDVIIHLAGKAHDTTNIIDINAYAEINTELTKKVYNLFLRSKSKKFIFFSSVKAVADSIADNILKEDLVPNPKTPYGISKLLAENYILNELRPHKDIFILRPCMIHGPGNKGNLNLLYNLFSRGFPWPLGAFQNKRSFCSIDNVMFIINELIEREDIPSGVYNVADDEALSTNGVVSILAESQNRKLKIWVLPQGLIKLFAKFGNVFRLPLTTERLQKLTESYIVSNQKIKSAIGKQLPVSAREGLLKTFNSFHTNVP